MKLVANQNDKLKEAREGQELECDELRHMIDKLENKLQDDQYSVEELSESSERSGNISGSVDL